MSAVYVRRTESTADNRGPIPRGSEEIRPGLLVSRLGPPGKLTNLGSPQRWVYVHVTRRQRGMIYRTIDRVKAEHGTEYDSVALDWMCQDYWSGSAPFLPEHEPPADARRRGIAFYLYPDQLDWLVETLDLAVERGGYADAGTALAAIANEFTRWRDAPLPIDQCNGAAASAVPGREQAANPRQPGEPRNAPHNRSKDGSGTTRAPAVPCPHRPQHLADCPAPPAPASVTSRGGTSRAGSIGRPRAARSDRAAHGYGAADAIPTREVRRPSREWSNLQVEALDPIPILPCRSVRDLADTIGAAEPILRALWREAPWLYDEGWIPKSSGGWRPVWMPDELLKAVQRGIAQRILGPLVDSPIAYGIEGRTHIDAACLHVRMPYVGTVDIEDFFPSVTEGFVRTLLCRMGCDADLVEILTGILTFSECLATGAPTSPAVAGLLLAASDRRLYTEAQRLGVVLTRYVDDYAISGTDRAAIIEMMGLIELELRRLGLRSNSSKRSIRPRNEPQIVHGLHVNNGASIPKPYRKTVRAAVHQAARDGCSEKRFRQLMGQVNYIAQLHRREARKLGATLRSARIVEAQVRGETIPKEAA